uniref:Uncharacterized protein n=1 Tax=Timema poppense TaxID=170557 RepID=A0A7R9GZT1_TIMPO|nr:unnamed protein product [Timema poppensis]
MLIYDWRRDNCANVNANARDKRDFNGGSVIQSLMVLLVTAPQIPFKYHNTCSRMIEDFRNFSSFVWNKLPEAESDCTVAVLFPYTCKQATIAMLHRHVFAQNNLNNPSNLSPPNKADDKLLESRFGPLQGLIRLQAEITNTATAVLYEILMTMERLQSKTLSISLRKLLDGLPFKCYVRRSVTQLLGLIFPIQPNKLQAVEAVLVYQHLFVIKCFMKNIPEVKDYIKQHFQEEFRYYICWSRVEHRLPDVFPVKSFVQQLVEEVHEMATQSNNPNMKSNIFS